MSQMRLLSKIPINLQFHTYLPRVEKESDFRNAIIGFQLTKQKTVSIGYKVIRLTNCRTLKSWA